MITAKGNLIGKINAKQNLTGKINNKEIVVYPELEDLEVTPSGEEQNFKSNKYGYNNVKVKAVESEELTIVPSTEEQVKEGLYGKVTVVGDNNLVPENIKEGTGIFGVEGKMPAGWDTSQIRQCYRMFQNNTEMIEAPYFDTSNVTNMTEMFNNCSNLKIVPQFDTSNVTNMSYMFGSCSRLTEVGGLLDLGKAYTSKTSNYSNYKLDLHYSNNLTHESLMNIINNLYDLNLTYDVANGGTLYRQSCVLGSTNLAKLQATEEGLQALTNADAKGWNIS